MEINGKDLLATGVQRLAVHEHSPNSRQQHAGVHKTASEADRLELSVESRAIQDLDGRIQATPDIRDAKVEQVRRAIENGTYNVKAEKIAEKLLGGNLLDEIF